MRREPLFVDSSVIIRGIELEKCNSMLILDLIADRKQSAVISVRVLEEVTHYFARLEGEKFAYAVAKYLRRIFRVIPRPAIESEVKHWRGKIKEKDLEHLATAKKFGAHIIAFDRDFEPFKEYITPKKFIQSLKIKPFETEY